jgi:WD40 repeat protein
MSAHKVFLSHTSVLARLPEGRSFVQAAKDAALRAGLNASDMQFFPADDRPPAQVCEDAVRACGIYVGVFGHDYGSRVRGQEEVSYTELEFLTALEERRHRGMRVFAFLLREGVRVGDHDRPDAEQEAFRRRVCNDHGLTAKFFDDPKSLELEVYDTLLKALSPTAPADRRLQHKIHLSDNFTGRQADLDAAERVVRDSLASGATLSFVGFRGMGGVGKSTLAAALADRLAADHRLFPAGVLWANLLDKAPEDIARDWVRDLGGDVTGLTPEQCLTRFHELAAVRRPLIVLDNVPRVERGESPAGKLMVRAPGVATLLTTRFRQAVPLGLPVHEVDALTADDARALLRRLIPAKMAADPDAGERVIKDCDRLPLFLEVAAQTVTNWDYSLAGYADELRKRGLAMLSDEDERARVVFDISWQHLSAEGKELFAVLALAPGQDVGVNLAAAWLRQSGHTEASEGHKPARWLAEVANTALLKVNDGDVRRYRYHDRVRDYALGKLTLLREEVVRGLMACYCDWEMVKAEFTAVKAAGLAEQYQRLRAWEVEEPPDFGPWFHFIRGQASVLALYPELFYQQAFNEPVDSPVSRAAQQRVGVERGEWLEWVNRPREWAPSASLMVLRGHSGGVGSVVVTSDGRAVSVSEDATVRVWDLSTGACLRILEGHTNTVRRVAVTSDGRAVSASWDTTVRVWDLSSGRCLHTLEGHSWWVASVAVTSDGRAVSASESEDDTLRVWDLSTGACLRTLEGHTDVVRSVAVTSDGRAVSGSDDKTLRVWDLSSGRCLHTLEGHSWWVASVAVTSDGRAVSASGDKTVRVWDLSTGACLHTLEGHTGGVGSVVVTSDGRAVSASGDTTVRVWDLSAGAWARTLSAHTGGVTSVAVTSDGRAVSASEDETVRVWDLSTGACLRILEGHAGRVMSVAVTSDGRAVSASGDKTVRVWDLSTGACLRTLEGHADTVWCVAVTSDGRAVSASGDMTLRVWDLSRGPGLRTLEGHADTVRSVAVTSDGRAVSTSHDNTVRVWDLSSGRCLRTLEGYAAMVRSVAVTSDGRAVSTSHDNTVRVWDLSTGPRLRTLEGHADAVRSVAVTSDGRGVSLSSGQTRVWDLSTGACIAALGSEEARQVWATTDRGGPLTTGVEPHGLTLRATADGAIRLRFPGTFTDVDCSTDGRHVVAGDGGGGVYILKVHMRGG